MGSEKKDFSFTNAQQRAIDARGGAVIVSAAAGSGKTRVLVQRVIEMLSGDPPVPADRLLILTFANKAADEMKTRISAALDKKIRDNPDDPFYRRQQLMLGSADICTVHAFCGKIVRENFFRLGISRDFRIGSTNELEELKGKLMSELIERRYTMPDESDPEYTSKMKDVACFRMLACILSGTKLDKELGKELIRAYTKYTSHAFPQIWMNRCVEAYSDNIGLSDSREGKIAVQRLLPYIPMLRQLLSEAQKERNIIEEKASRKKAPKLYEKFLDTLDSYEMFIDEAEEYLSEPTRNIGRLFASCAGLDISRLSAGRMGAKDNGELLDALAYANGIYDILEQEFLPYGEFSEEVYLENNRQLYPVLRCLKSVLEEFDDVFFRAKCEKEILDFDDLQRLMLKLLYDCDEQSGKYIKSRFAYELSEKYEEIMVDEYQDTNDVQESIFRAVSRNEENLFVVGDIKQSIYRFRDARPELFKARCSSALQRSSKAELIILDRNFRSRDGIIDGVNFIFSLLMSEQAGEVDYDESQRLSVGADYEEHDEADCELHLLEYHKQNDDDDSDDEDDNIEKTEAAYCASLIRNMVSQGVTVRSEKSGNGQTVRRAGYGDFCILLRSVKNKAHTYSYELERLGIPVYTDADLDLLERYEIKAAIACMKIINNPTQDIPMLAALMCPVYGFTPDETAAIRTAPGKSIYKKLLYLTAHADEGGELEKKCRDFVNGLRDMRTMSAVMPSDRLMQEFFERTSFVPVMQAMPDGVQRVQNLRRLISYAAEYEASSGGGISGFVRHISYLESSGEGIRVSDAAPADAVRIMTIHHSKGLEFPVCIIGGTNSRTKPSNDRVRYHSDMGIGLNAIDTQRLLRFDTLQRSTIRRLCSDEDKSEQLRILYVALTRAKEKLIMLSTVKTEPQSDNSSEQQNVDGKKAVSPLLSKYVSDLASRIQYDEQNLRIHPSSVLSCKTFSDLIIMCSLLNRSMPELREIAGECAENLPLCDCGRAWKFVHVPDVSRERANKIASEPEHRSDEKLLRLMKERFAEKAPDYSTIVPSKVSASMLAHKGLSIEYVASSVPDFARSDRVSPSERGSATHSFLQYADFAQLQKSAESGDFSAERERLLSEGKMSERELSLVSEDSISAFVGSSLFARLIKAKRVYKEYRFTVNIPGNLVVNDIPEQDSGGCRSVLQGAIDCIAEEEDGYIIADYKTDRVKDPQQLLESYQRQLQLYRYAAEQLFDKPVTYCCIYSLYTGKEIPVTI